MLTVFLKKILNQDDEAGLLIIIIYISWRPGHNSDREVTVEYPSLNDWWSGSGLKKKKAYEGSVSQ